MDIDRLEKTIKNYRISKPQYRSKNNDSIPSMLSVFRSMIVDGIPPVQDEFVEEFRKTNPNIKMRGVISRLRIAYLSFVREYHLEFLLKNHFDEVIYSEATDIAGIDFIVIYKDYEFNLHAFVQTKNSLYWRGVKNGRHNFQGIHLDLPMNLSSGKRVGKFILYTDNHIKKLKKDMEKIINERNN